MSKTLTSKKLIGDIVVSLVILVVIMCVCACVGSQKISLRNVFSGPGETAGNNIDYEIFAGIRLPRVILAALVGAALACSGVILQAILRNPLADPYILGVSSGAGLGAIIAILSGLSYSFIGGSPVALFAFAASVGTVWLVWFIGHFAGKSNITSLLLAGVVVNAFFSAVIMFFTSIAKSHQLRATVLWLMGNITEKSPNVLWISGICIMLGIVWILAISQRLNILSLGEEQAHDLGINTTRLRFVAFGLAAFVTSIAVSLSGLIGFVGLIVPHGVRLVFGPDHRRLLPLAAIAGAGFLVIADTLARSIFGQEQLPVGVITAIAGGPFFLVLLAKYTRKISWLK